MKLVIEDDLFTMSNLSPKRTGLPFVVWISPRDGAQHDVRVKISRSPRATPGEFISVTVRPTVAVVNGVLSNHELALLRKWIELNREVLVKFWEGEIEYTEDVLAQLQSI
jgi:hypothetical protein